MSALPGCGGPPRSMRRVPALLLIGWNGATARAHRRPDSLWRTAVHWPCTRIPTSRASTSHPVSAIPVARLGRLRSARSERRASREPKEEGGRCTTTAHTTNTTVTQSGGVKTKQTKKSCPSVSFDVHAFGIPIEHCSAACCATPSNILFPYFRPLRRCCGRC